jgi:hypothetical protein
MEPQPWAHPRCGEAVAAGLLWDEAGRLDEWLAEAPVEAQLLKLSEKVGEVCTYRD